MSENSMTFKEYLDGKRFEKCSKEREEGSITLYEYFQNRKPEGVLGPNIIQLPGKELKLKKEHLLKAIPDILATL